jgi:pyruvate dehydrogenase E1 component beta subunit
VQTNYVELGIAVVAAIIVFVALSWLKRIAANVARASAHRAHLKSIVARTLARTSKFFRVMVSIELVNQIAKVRYMFGGQARASLVARMPHGLMAGSAAQHSQIIESWFVNVPGLVVAAPSTALDLAGLLRTALRSDDPVVFFEPKALFKTSADMPDDWPAIPFGKAAHLMAGDDVTIVSWAQAMPVAKAAAAELADARVGVDLFDLRSLWPWDREAIVASATRTRRLVVVQEGVGAAGFGAEVSATVGEAVGALKGIRRVASPRIPVPFAPTLEEACWIRPGMITRAVKEVLAL